ncbi:MAG: YbjN domain-containing protein [Bacteroidales bacterium]|nr:YbjN domain-containing protein [Bacteroidales bacterium]
MGIFNKIFSESDSDKHPENIPNIQFGRYTDRHKTPEQISSWDKSIALYKEKKYLDSYFEFFNYLRDPKVDNVKISKETDKIKFEIIQGSKVVKGYASNAEVTANSEIASFKEKPHVAVMRKLLGVNYDLFFSKFAIKDNTYVLKFSANVLDAPTEALYASLKEVANQADKYDDVLTDEFSFLKEVNIDHIEELPESEKEVKYNYLITSVNDTIKRTEELTQKDLAGAGSFLLLQLTFKIYYLLAPEGVLLDDLRYIQGVFFRHDNSTTAEKNHLMVEEFKKVITKPKDKILKSLYKAKATFAVVKPTNYQTVADFIFGELKKIEWYKNNNYFDVQQAICDYIVAYAEFSYGMDAPVYELFEIYWKATNDKYYKNLGFNVEYYNSETKEFKQSKIENDILKIISNAKRKYINLDFKTHLLKFTSLHEFSTSFLTEIEKLNFNIKQA